MIDTEDTEQHRPSHTLDYRNRPLSHHSHVVVHDNNRKRLQLQRQRWQQRQQRRLEVSFSAAVWGGRGLVRGDVGDDRDNNGGSDK